MDWSDDFGWVFQGAVVAMREIEKTKSPTRESRARRGGIQAALEPLAQDLRITIVAGPTRATIRV